LRLRKCSPSKLRNAVECRERLWRSPLWKIQVRLRQPNQVLDEQAQCSCDCCGKRGTTLRYTSISATGSPSYDGWSLYQWGLAHSCGNRLMHRDLVSIPHYHQLQVPRYRWCTDAGIGTVSTDNEGCIPMTYKDYVDTFTKDMAETITQNWPIEHAVN